LIEVLAAVAIIGIITFLAIPNIIRIKEESEQSLAISRAEGLNLAMASFVQANGHNTATSIWTGAQNNNQRYLLVAPYLAYAPGTVASYMPGGFTATFPTQLLPLQKVTLIGPDNQEISY